MNAVSIFFGGFFAGFWVATITIIIALKMKRRDEIKRGN